MHDATWPTNPSDATRFSNSTNTPHFSNPNTNISAANFLVVTAAQPDQRQVRVGLRLSW